VCGIEWLPGGCSGTPIRKQRSQAVLDIDPACTAPARCAAK